MLEGIIVALIVATILYNVAFVISGKHKPIKPTKFDSKVEMNKSGDYFEKYYEEHNIGRPTMVELPKETEELEGVQDANSEQQLDGNLTEDMYEVELLTNNNATNNNIKFDHAILNRQLKDLSPQMFAVIFGNILNKKY